MPGTVLNADYTPLSYYPLSVWPWQTAIKAVFLDRVDIVAITSARCAARASRLRLPSVIALKQYVRPSQFPAFTRFNLFLRDKFACQYCGINKDLTFDHVIPRAQGGRTTWENVATACAPCNLKKGGRTPKQAAHAAAHRTDPADQLAAAGTWPALPAQLPARDVARLALLGRGAGGLGLPFPCGEECPSVCARPVVHSDRGDIGGLALGRDACIAAATQ
jgi:5-methylcytosine-specific restriction endonuclease McrA